MRDSGICIPSTREYTYTSTSVNLGRVLRTRNSLDDEIHAFALISRRNLNAYHVPPRLDAAAAAAAAGIIITEQLSCGSLGPFARWQTRRRRFTYLSDIRPCLTINSHWRISQVTLKFHEWLSTDKSPSCGINPIADEGPSSRDRRKRLYY